MTDSTLKDMISGIYNYKERKLTMKIEKIVELPITAASKLNKAEYQ